MRLFNKTFKILFIAIILLGTLSLVQISSAQSDVTLLGSVDEFRALSAQGQTAHLQQVRDLLQKLETEQAAATSGATGAQLLMPSDAQRAKDISLLKGYLTGLSSEQGRLSTAEIDNMVNDLRNEGLRNDAEAATSKIDEVPDVCGWGLNPANIGCSMVRAGVSLFHYTSRFLGEKVLRLANILFNQVFQITVRDFSTYIKTSDNSVGAVQRGWTISRDLVNMALIFVLIYAALGLILNLGSNHKQIVSRVIIIALLVNFSAMLTGVAIDASNIVANQFYEMAGRAGKGTPAYSAGNAPDITTVILDKTTKGTNVSGLEQAVKDGTISRWGALTRIVVNDIMMIPFFLITTVVLVAGSIMFFVRMLTLIFLIMVAPLAFLAWALPGKPKQYFDKWLNKLISNAIFAPAFFFMFMITVMSLGNGQGSLGSLGNKMGEGDLGYINNIIYLVMVNGMMVGSLLIAREFGAYGAGGAMGWLNNRQTGLRSRFRSLGSGAASLTTGRLGVMSRRLAGRGAERLQESDNIGARIFRRIPLMNRVAGAVGATARADIPAIQARVQAMNLSDAALRNRMTSIATSQDERAAIANILASRNQLTPGGNLTQQMINQAVTTQQVLRMPNAQTRPITNLAYQYAGTGVTPGATTTTAAGVTINAAAAQRAQAISGGEEMPAAPGVPSMPRTRAIAPAAVGELERDNYFDVSPGQANHDANAFNANQPVRESMYRTFAGGHIDQLLQRNDDPNDHAADRFFVNLRNDFEHTTFFNPHDGLLIEHLADWIATPVTGIPGMPNSAGMNNRRLATWITSPAGRNTLGRYGFIPRP